MAATRKGLVLFARKRGNKGQKTFGVLFCIYSVRRESDLRSEKMENWFIGPCLLTEEDIPGSSLSGRNPFFQCTAYSSYTVILLAQQL